MPAAIVFSVLRVVHATVPATSAATTFGLNAPAPGAGRKIIGTMSAESIAAGT